MGNLELLSIFYVAVTTSVTLLTIFLCVLKICFKSKVSFRQISLNFKIVFSLSSFSAKTKKMSITTQGKNCRFKTFECCILQAASDASFNSATIKPRLLDNGNLQHFLLHFRTTANLQGINGTASSVRRTF